MNQGITFTVYGEQEGLERIFPFDFVPRIIPAAEWERSRTASCSASPRSTCSSSTSTSEQRCLEDGVVPPELVFSRQEYKRELLGLIPPRSLHPRRRHRPHPDDRGDYLVLEDNCRARAASPTCWRTAS